MVSTCKLCKKNRELQDSHVIPKLIYRYMRKYQDSTNKLNGLLTLDSQTRKVDVTQRQWKEKLFCKSCEELLSKNETKFARILHDVNSMTKESLSKEFYTTDKKKIIDLIRNERPSISVDELIQEMNNKYFNDPRVETLKYFSASYVLRQLYIIDNSLGDKWTHMLEDYLLGKESSCFTLVVKLNCGDNFKAFSSSFALDELDDFKHYNFIVPEMWFHLIFDRDEQLDVAGVTVLPENFMKNDEIYTLLSKPYENASLTKKAKVALEVKI